MIRDLLKWLACGFVVVLGLALVSWGPSVPSGSAQAEREARAEYAVASGGAPQGVRTRAQP